MSRQAIVSIFLQTVLDVVELMRMLRGTETRA
jgi:hypothetical protein